MNEYHVPILIYQMGKVGSSSIYFSLKSLYSNTYHVHTLNSKILANLKAQYNVKDRGLPGHWSASDMILSNNLLAEPLKIITLVREPINRNFSAFFENIDGLLSKLKIPIYTLTKDIDPSLLPNFEVIRTHLEANGDKQFYTSFSLISNYEQIAGIELNGKYRLILLNLCFNPPPGFAEKLTDLFISNYHHDIPERWFKREYKKVLGYDIYNDSFDKCRGYEFKTIGDKHDILIMKAELENSKKYDLVRKFLDNEEIEFQDHNVGSNKYYSELYQEFKNIMKLDKSFVKQMHSSTYATHFYTEEDLSDSTKKWTSK